MECSITLRDIITWVITLGGIGIAWWQFASRMTAIKQSRIKTQKETWFLQVIVLPSFPRLEAFYKELIGDLIEQIDNIKLSANSTSVTAHSEKISLAKADFIANINEFFEQFNSLVESADPSVGRELKKLTLQLQDTTTKLLDNYATTSHTDIKNVIFQNKKIVLSSLNSSIRP